MPEHRIPKDLKIKRPCVNESLKT